MCPFIPISNITMKECVELSKKFARELAAELDVPVFLYEEAATCPARKNLADIRKGEYEGLADKVLVSVCVHVSVCVCVCVCTLHNMCIVASSTWVSHSYF